MVLEVEVQAGNQTAPEFAHAGLFGWLDARPRQQWPTLLRGDVAWGTEKTMAEAEKRDLPYLFKLRQSDGVKELMRRSVGRTAWAPAGGGWQGVEEVLQLQGWTRQRRVVVLRRALPQDVAMVDRETDGRQERLVGMVVMNPAKPMYEYAVLVTTAAVKDVLSVAQLYRDRADAENIFDEMKNQWGWSGFTTQDLARCQLMARINALVFNWWSLYTRLALPGKHTEATTSRPMLVYGLGKKTRHSQQEGEEDTGDFDDGGRVPEAVRAKCGAVERQRTVGPPAENHLAGVLSEKGRTNDRTNGQSGLGMRINCRF